MEDMFQARTKRYAVHDAVERNDVEALKDLLGLNKPTPPVVVGGEAGGNETTQENGNGEGEREREGAQAIKPQDPSAELDAEGKAMKVDGEEEEEEDSDDSGDKDFGENDDDDDDESEEENEQNQLDVHDDSSCTPLHVALLNGSLDCLILLLQEGADSGIGCEGNPLIHVAISVGAIEAMRDFSCEAVKVIMKYCGAEENVQITDDFRRTPLHLAADLGLAEIAEVLLSTFKDEESGSYKDAATIRDYLLARDRLGNTALHYACWRGHLKLVSLILETAKSLLLGENENLNALLCTTKNFKKCVPLHLALREGFARIACKLLAYDPSGSSLKSKDILGNNPLVDAIAYGHKNLHDKILEQKTKGGLIMDEAAFEADALESARDEVMMKNKTLIIRSDVCENHFTCRPASLYRGYLNSAPPENVLRLKVLTSPLHGGILTSSEFSAGKEYQWENDPPKAKMADVLRVHEWHYIRHVQEVCEGLSDMANDVDGIGSLDGDTSLSRFTFDAAFTAAGASILAVDKVMEESKNEGVSKVFCAVRPPGHHAGPTGAVSGGSTDPTVPMMGGSQSHGFCLLNNVAVAAAYAMNVYRKKIKKVALIDFDVHHGNGTEACVSSVTPRVVKQKMAIGGNDGSGTLQFEGFVRSHKFKPWFDVSDRDAILFASCQGYGETIPGTGHMFYPGTGATYDTNPPKYFEGDGEYLTDNEQHEFGYRGGSRPYECGPRIINVGIRGPKSERSLWKRAWRDKILPAVNSHEPDLILISAGFDAHAKDDMNSGYIGLLECDYEWVTGELVKIANKHSEGRIVSVLEGGYRIQGGIVSPFARSVAAHVRALGQANMKKWNSQEAKYEREREIRIEQEKLRKQQEELQKLLAEREEVAGQPPLIDSEMKADMPPAGNEGPSSPKRRRRTATSSIDYVALNAQLEKEAAEAANKNPTTGN